VTGTYVDTNVLVYAFGDPAHPKRRASRILMEEGADSGDLVTSVLAIDEFLWVRRRTAGSAIAAADARTLLSAPVLQILAVERVHADSAIEHVERFNLRPRDAFHLAVMRTAGCSRLLSDDPDFDAVPGVRRFAPGS
jgi:uncharacterized protein